MNINNRYREITYLIILSVLVFLLIREYTYIHPFNTGFFILGPKWTYTSTRTFTWWFLIISSIVMVIPLFRMQKIGFLGLILFISVYLRPYIQIKFPEETAFEFYNDRRLELKLIINDYKKNKNLNTEKVKDLGFEKLIVKNETFYFLVGDEEWPFGICFSELTKLPTQNFQRELNYLKLDKYWYEFDY